MRTLQIVIEVEVEDSFSDEDEIELRDGINETLQDNLQCDGWNVNNLGNKITLK